MGLLPAEHLIEPPAGAVRDPPKPVPIVIPPLKAENEVVLGVRIGGECTPGELSETDREERKLTGNEYSVGQVGEMRGVTEEMILVEAEGFEHVPTALRLGFPLMFKRLHEVQDATGETLEPAQRIYIFSLMETPGLGLPITWNLNGKATKLPPLLAVRSDGVPFTRQDWKCLTEFQRYLEETYIQFERPWHYTPADFKKWVRIFVNSQCLMKTQEHPEAFADIDPCLDRRFPLGLRVKAVGVSKEELNGRVGTVEKYDLARGRVGVLFAQPYGLLSLKAANLYIDPAERATKLLSDLQRKK
ncbi:hypothetical protein AB1Y20_016260 [Prymnesium parvum]|uniref:Uncharacterized protein n=1 Tax=Prymnesium parvum TaxID=97485 RepID=A0AB34IER4_PRYPA